MYLEPEGLKTFRWLSDVSSEMFRLFSIYVEILLLFVQKRKQAQLRVINGYF